VSRLGRLAPPALLAGALLVAVLATSACGGGGSDHADVPERAPTATNGTVAADAVPPAYVATANGATVEVFDRPGAATPKLRLPNPWLVDPSAPSSEVPQVFLVEDRRDPDWVEVLLPVRPNGSRGWVRASDVSLAATPYRVRVELGAHRITVTNGASVVHQGPVATGAPATPTPTGSYYLRVLLRAPEPGGAYGPYAYGLSSHSDALETFSGGDAEIGIHGNDDVSVLGTSVTHGCIRIDNAAITDLAGRLPLGTPVDVVA